MCGFIAQLVEHRTSIAEVTGLNPIEALIFSGFSFQLLKLEKFTAMIILHFHLQPQFKNELFHTLHIISLLTGDMNSINQTSLPMCGFIAQLVEQRTGNAKVTGSNPVEALIFFRLLLPIA